jgi:hypothetical protein
MRKFLAHVVGVLLALLVSGAVWVWLWVPRPMWRQELELNGELAPRFRDNQVVVTTHISATHPERVPFVSFWEIETGRLMRRVEVRLPADAGIPCSIQVEGNANIVQVATSTEAPSPIGAAKANRFYLYDLDAGRVVHGPFEKNDFTYGSAELSVLMQVSPRSMYFLKRYPSSGIVRGSRTVEVFDMKTGKLLTTFQKEPTKTLVDFAFSPDDAALAVLWGEDLPKSSGYAEGFSRQFSLAVHDLPSGQLRFVVPKVGNYGVNLKRWQDNILYVGERSSPGEFNRVFKAFILSKQSWSEIPGDTLLRDKQLIYCTDFGSDWVSYLRADSPSQPRPAVHWTEKVRDWLLLWVRDSQGSGVYFHFEMLNRPDGSLRYKSPRPVRGGLFVTPNGQRLVCMNAPAKGMLGQASGIEVWNLEPPLKWPYAVGSGAVTYAVWFAMRKYRSRRQAQTISLV